MSCFVVVKFLLQIAACDRTAMTLDELVQFRLVVSARPMPLRAIGILSDGVPQVFHGASRLGDGLRKTRQLLLQLLVANDAVGERTAPGLCGRHQLNDSFQTSVATKLAAAPVPGRHAASDAHVSGVAWFHHAAVELVEFAAHCISAQLRFVIAERLSVNHNNLQTKSDSQKLVTDEMHSVGD